MSRTRVCYVVPSLSVGGAEQQLVYLVRGLADDYDITVACTHHDGPFSGDVRRTGARVHVLGVRSGWDFTMRGKLRRVLRSKPPDVVHSFLFGFDLWANRAARDVGVPVVISSRRELAVWQKRRHRLMQQWANRYVDCIVANSRAGAEHAIQQERADRARFRVIHNGIDADAFVSRADPRILRERYRLPFHTRVVGIVANFSPVKDHALFVETAAELLRRRADVHFLMVGAGPLAAHIEQQIERRGLRGCFTRIATTSEMPDLYAVMDACVLCSKVEGCPNAVMESMAAGTPVVAAAVGGIPELVRDGDTGRLVASRKPHDFAEAIEWALDRPDQSRAMTERAAQRVRLEFTVDKMVTAHRALYTELLMRNQPATPA